MRSFANTYYSEEAAVNLILLDRSVQLPDGSYTIISNLKAADALTVTLPPAESNADQIITVEAIDLGKFWADAGSVTVNTNGRDKVAITALLDTVGDFIVFYCTGDRWWDVCQYIA